MVSTNSQSLDLQQNLQESTKYVALWKSVILQAFLDLRSISMKKMAKVHRNQAHKWLNLHNAGFLKVCAMAELDPRYVYARKLHIIEEREKRIRKIELEKQAGENVKKDTQENTTNDTINKDNKKANQKIQRVA